MKKKQSFDRTLTIERRNAFVVAVLLSDIKHSGLKGDLIRRTRKMALREFRNKEGGLYKLITWLEHEELPLIPATLTSWQTIAHASKHIPKE